MTTRPNNRVREYETIYILKGDVDADTASKVANRVFEVITRDGGKLAITPGVWQHVKYTFNPAQGVVTLQLDSLTATAGTSDTTIEGIDFEFGPGLGTGPMYVDNVVIKQGAAPTPPAATGSRPMPTRPDRRPGWPTTISSAC